MTPLTIRVLSVVLLASSLACRKPSAAQATTQGAAGQAAKPEAAAGAPATVKPVPAQLPDVLAKVNGESVARGELEVAVRNLEARAQAPVPAEQRDQVYRQVLDRIVGYRLLVQEARLRKIDVPAAELESRMQQMRGQFPNEEAFTAALKQRGMTIEKLRQETTDTLAVNALLQKEVEPQVSVQDKEIADFYAKNTGEFKEGEAVHAAHILIRVPENADAAARAKAKAQAESVLKQVTAGKPFGDLAKKFSGDPGSAGNGGDLGFFSKGQMVPAFETAAFALKPGQTSGLVETPFGYHIIKVIETRAAREMTLDQVKDQIKNYLTEQQRSAKSEAFVATLRAKSKVEILL